jgi:hypothetical protein
LSSVLAKEILPATIFRIKQIIDFTNFF